VRGTPDERFWAKVEKTSTCWNWTGGTVKGGYGWFHDGDKNVQAHRYSWERKKGPIPNGLWVLHKCDNTRCVRPGHLYLGTGKHNADDRSRRKRHFKHRQPERFREHISAIRYRDGHPGEHNGMAKLNWSLVREIRARTSETRRSLAREYGVSVQAVCNLMNGKTWKEAA
jgi:hypothetical protein